MYELWLDAEKKLIRVRIEGMMSVEEARRFDFELGHLAPEARRRFSCFRLVADTAKATVQPLEVTAALPGPAGFMRDPLDRWAVVVGSSLAKIQAGRVLAHPQAKAFLSMNAAETWALAYDCPTDTCGPDPAPGDQEGP